MMFPKDLAKALDLAAELQADKEFSPHTLVAYAQQMANALVKHRGLLEALPELVGALENAATLLDESGSQASVDEAARVIRAAFAKAKDGA